jgi:hypothetical protein
MVDEAPQVRVCSCVHVQRMYVCGEAVKTLKLWQAMWKKGAAGQVSHSVKVNVHVGNGVDNKPCAYACTYMYTYTENGDDIDSFTYAYTCSHMHIHVRLHLDIHIHNIQKLVKTTSQFRYTYTYYTYAYTYA